MPSLEVLKRSGEIRRKVSEMGIEATLLTNRFRARILTVEDHRQLIALDGSPLLASSKRIESVLKHGLFFFLLVCHQVLLVFHVAVVVSNLLSSSSINGNNKSSECSIAMSSDMIEVASLADILTRVKRVD